MIFDLSISLASSFMYWERHLYLQLKFFAASQRIIRSAQDGYCFFNLAASEFVWDLLQLAREFYIFLRCRMHNQIRNYFSERSIEGTNVIPVDVRKAKRSFHPRNQLTTPLTDQKTFNKRRVLDMNEQRTQMGCKTSNLFFCAGSSDKPFRLKSVLISAQKYKLFRLLCGQILNLTKYVQQTS